MPLVEVQECVFDAALVGLSHGYESLDSVGREAFVNHRHLSGGGRVVAAEEVTRSWAEEMRAKWPTREFRIYRQSETDEVTVRFHMASAGLPNWCEGGIEVIVVGGRDAE